MRRRCSVIDGGAYLTLSPVVSVSAFLHAAGPYRCDTVRIRGRAMATNYPPHGAFRGFGAPQTTFAYERQMDKAAPERLGIDQLRAFRERNMLRLGDTTCDLDRSLEYSVGSAQVLEAVPKKAAGAPGRSGDGAGAERRRQQRP